MTSRLSSLPSASPPLSLRDLRVWAVGGDGPAGVLASACRMEVLSPGAWRGRTDAPHFLLVEAHGEAPVGWGDELSELLGACGTAGVPRLLWITAGPHEPSCLECVESFDRVFTVDGEGLPALAEAGAREPSLLRAATALPVDPRLVRGTADRPHPVVWLGGWNQAWGEGWRERVTAILRAAADRGLRIVGVERPDLLPADLRQCVSAGSPGARREELEGARVAIGIDPVSSSRHVTPAAVFDAIAAGAAAISPHSYGLSDLFGRDLPPVHDRDSAAAALDLLLTDDRAREARVTPCRALVARNHTAAHRLATLASAAGHRLVPDASADLSRT
jgi:Glycosyl transferases group 1